MPGSSEDELYYAVPAVERALRNPARDAVTSRRRRRLLERVLAKA